MPVLEEVMAELREIARVNREEKEWGGFGLSDKLEFLANHIQWFLDGEVE